MCYILKKWIYLPPAIQKTFWIMKNKSFLIIRNVEGWHYLVVKKLLALLRGITSIHDGNF